MVWGLESVKSENVKMFMAMKPSEALKNSESLYAICVGWEINFDQANLCSRIYEDRVNIL
jgi:hypothetical protein